MPVDQFGNRAQIVMDPASIIARMNLARPEQLYICDAASHVVRKVKEILGNPQGKIAEVQRIILGLPKQTIDAAYNHILGFFEITIPSAHRFFRGMSLHVDRCEYLASCVTRVLILGWQVDNVISVLDAVRNIEASKDYHPAIGPVSYVGDSGKRVTTVENIRIADVYFMLLEKICDDWSAVSSGRLQHFGVLSPMTRSETHIQPYRQSPLKSYGETDLRVHVGYCGPLAVAEELDRNNSPATHRIQVQSILNAANPANIDECVDRKVIQFGNTKPLQLLNHMNMCAGRQIVWEPESDN